MVKILVVNLVDEHINSNTDGNIDILTFTKLGFTIDDCNSSESYSPDTRDVYFTNFWDYKTNVSGKDTCSILNYC